MCPWVSVRGRADWGCASLRLSLALFLTLFPSSCLPVSAHAVLYARPLPLELTVDPH